MKIPVIFIAAVVAVGATRPPRGFDSEYREYPSYVESPTPPPPLRSSFYRHLQPFRDDDDDLAGLDARFFGEGPPSRPRIYFADSPSSYFPARRPQTFHWDGPNNFREGQVISHEYRGPPPPPPSEDTRKQTSHQQNERPGSGDSTELRTKKPSEEPKSQNHNQQQQQQQQQHHQRNQHQYQHLQQPQLHHHQQQQQQHLTTAAELRQPLSFGGHSNYLSFGNHGLGFASVPGATSTDLNPLAVSDSTSTTKTATPSVTSSSGSTTISGSTLHQGVQVSQQQFATSPTTSATPASKIAGSAAPGQGGATESVANNTPSDSRSTTPTASNTTPVTPKSNLDAAQHAPHQAHGVSTMYHESPRTSYEFRTVTQELPAAAHGQLPIESPGQQLHLSDTKQNLLLYETKGSFPFPHGDYQFHQQLQQQLNNHNNNNNNVSPVRFSIPTTPISATPDTAQMKLTFPNLDFSRSPLTHTAVPNTYTVGQNQIDITQLANMNSAVNQAPSLPSYYFVQTQEQAKPAAQVSSGIPLGSFYILPNNAQAKQLVHQPTQISSGAPSGLQLQLGGFSGIQYLASPSNSEPMRPAVLEIGKVNLGLQEQFRTPESTLTKIGFGQSPW